MGVSLSKAAQALIIAKHKGYRVENGEVFKDSRKLKQRIIKMKGLKDGYWGFGVRGVDGVMHTILTHRLVAFQKFGLKIFKKGIQVRHLDNNSLNNLEDNIGKGTPSQNMMDKPAEVRLAAATKASQSIKIHDHGKIIEMHNNGMSYKKIMDATGIKSKGTISFIIKQSIEKKNIELAVIA